MQYLDNKNKLLDLITNKATVVTPNNRLSASLLKNYFQYSTHKTVDKPACLPYSNFLIQAYQNIKFQNPNHLHPTLINKTQCQHLWRTLLQSDASYTYSEGLLAAVMEAWDYCLLWQVEQNHPAFSYTPQTQQFQQWWQHISKQIEQLHLITEHHIVPYLIAADMPLAMEHMVWACFDSFNPQQIQLQQYLNRQGVDLYQYELGNQQVLPQLFAATDNKEEYQQMLAWLQLKIQDHQNNIAVVIPDLHDKAQSLHRLLSTHFDPAVFDISLGQNLAQFPLVAHGLSWLNLDFHELPQHQAALLLQSPYIGHAKSEFLSRSQFLQDSSLMQEQTLKLPHFIEDLRTLCPQLAQVLAQLTPFPASASIQDWIHLFQERLNLIGFPGDYGLNSENYQCFNRLLALFDEFRQLSLITPNLIRSKALETFSHLINSTIFQAQKTNTRIKISGLLEASGCEFDSLWVMGLSDHCLPQKTRLSAFIPPQMQKDLEMPHSLPSKELHFAQQTLQRLGNGSQSTVFSYSKMVGDAPNLPCSLISHLPSMQAIVSNDTSELAYEVLIEEENYLQAINNEERISGGTSLLENQAKCPFKAFAEHRLKAKPMPDLNEGINNMAKGQIIHKIMELIWNHLGSLQSLLTIDPLALEALIDQAINKVLSPVKTIKALSKDVEYLRLKRLVSACLEWEKQRPNFTVHSLEQEYAVNLAGIDFKVRVDRMDQVGDKKWVIDYKSNLPPSKPWNDDRPLAPQLLLYALLDEQINTLLLVQLKAGTCSCSGFSEDKQEIKGISTLNKQQTWEGCRETWQNQLHLLAEEFQQGHCAPQPANSSICGQCDFQNLCRVQIV